MNGLKDSSASCQYLLIDFLVNGGNGVKYLLAEIMAEREALPCR